MASEVSTFQIPNARQVGSGPLNGVPGAEVPTADAFADGESGSGHTGWPLIPIGELCRVSAGATPSRAAGSRYFSRLGTPWVKTLDLNEGPISATDEALTEVAVSELRMRVFPAGSVLVAMYGGWGQIGRTSILQVPAAVNQAISVLEARADLDSKYLLIALQHGRRRWRQFAASTRKDPNITKSDVLEFSIPVPPLTEQRRIVAVTEAVTAQERAIEASIAKLSRLLFGVADRISAELKDGPMGRVGELFEVGGGITLGPDRNPRGRERAYLRVANVQRGYIDSSSLAHVEQFPGDEAKYALREGDLLVVEGHANPNEIGRCAVIAKRDSGYFYQNHLFRLRSACNIEQFSEFWLNSDTVRSYWRKVAATSSGLYTISRVAVESVPFPLVDIDEQFRIVESLRSCSEQLEMERLELAKLRTLKLGLVEDLLACGV
ncbi:restriction endonuclease subunit S [Streptomyces sp. NPDC054841]